jgi:hypothetical protein
MARIITPQIDTILMIHCISPRTHFRGQWAIELLNLARIWIDGKEKKRSFVLPKGEVDGIHLPCLSRT